MKKKIFLFLGSIALFVCVLCAYIVKNDDGESDTLTDAQAAKIAFDDKFLNFNRYVYPDCYAGSYYSDNGEKLIINVTAMNTGDFDFLLNEFDCVELNLVKYSMQELYERADIINKNLANDFSEIEFAQAAVDLYRNCVVIELFQETIDNDDVMRELQLYFNDQPVIFEPPKPAPLL